MFRKLNADAVVRSAITIRSLSEAALPASVHAVKMSSSTGVPVGKVSASRLLLMQLIVDNSGSMLGFEPSVFQAYSKLLNSQLSAAGAAGTQTLACTYLLNGGMIIPYTKVQECPQLDSSNYQCTGGTPLYTAIQSVLGTMLVKNHEAYEGSRSVQTFTVVISDGAATDAAETDPATVRAVLTGLNPKEHIVCGIAIGGAAEETYKNLGISPNWILDPARDPEAFDAAMQKVAQASQSASQGSAAFQAVARQGLANLEYR